MTQAGARRDAAAAVGLVAIALLLGGGNWLFPLNRLLVELTAVLILAWFCLRPWRLPETRAIRTAAILFALAMLLLLVQLIPLPASIWHGLPGRDLARAVYAALGETDRAAPISLDPAATRDTIAMFLVPIAAFVVALRIGRDGRHQLLMVVAAFCLLNALIVAVQSQGLEWLTPYTSYRRPGTALFANKNHCALFLVATMPAVVWTILEYRPRAAITPTARRWIAVGAVGFVSLTVFGCLSRAGLALLPIGVTASALLIVPPSVRGRRAGIALGGFALVALLLVVVLPRTAIVAQALARFDAQTDLRYLFWPVVIDAIKTFFPVGSGFGTFRPVFAALEPLSIVKPTFVNNAHSDYLEIALEGGAAGIALIAAFILWFAVTTTARLWTCRRGTGGFAPIVIATAGILEILLHSIVDYPLRTLAFTALIATYCAILAAAPTVLDLQKLNCYRASNRRRARTDTDRTARSGS